ILEHLSFDTFREIIRPKNCHALIAPYVTRHRLDEWLSVIADIVFHTLKTPFLDGFALCEIPQSHLYKEMEFLYPADTLEIELPGKKSDKIEADLLKGYIDLAFVHRGKYYLVDWKSNWLGPSAADYTPDRLSDAMQASGYGLQAKIYTEAFKR